MARKAISKKTRFEIFKRDEFTCQYCGSFPPEVLLHIDHIIPVAQNGSNEMDNLITSCSACNQGKGAISLSSIPKSLKDKAKQVAESEAQIKGYAAAIQAKEERLKAETWDIIAVLENDDQIENYDKSRFRSIKHFLAILPYHEVLEAAEITSSKWASIGYGQFKYFCGICWAKAKRGSRG